ncbi:MAG: redox-sensing transcriptional repressor Rex [Clostridiales bacterium]|nr:redox-sensing transcriptional repressor Rex [Clostridiales bacterium]
MKKIASSISANAYHRITRYLNYLIGLSKEYEEYISSTNIGDALNINNVVVRKDLSIVSGNGKSKIGYDKLELIRDIKKFLGHDTLTNSVLVGVGHLGQALLSYKNFKKYGLNIVTAFDISEKIVGKIVNNTKILNSKEIVDSCIFFNVKVGIITTPDFIAQEVAEALVNGGVSAIWNFAPCELKVPNEISVKYEDMAASLAILIKQLNK